jgi:general secretion pathway protein D
MKTFFAVITLALLVLPGSVFPAPTTTPRVIPPYEGTSGNNQPSEEPAVLKDPSLQQDQIGPAVSEPGLSDPEVSEPVYPPGIPPGTTFSPEQIKQYLSRQKTKSGEENYIILNFDNASLRDVINTISSITGENFILGSGLDARITIHSTGKIPTSEALDVFESVLEINNMALVRSGRFFKIVPIASAKQKPVEIITGYDPADIPGRDRVVTQIVQIEYVPTAEMIKVLQPLLSPYGSIIPNPRNNLLIINDIQANLKRLLSILNELDVDTFQNTRIGFFQPKFSDVTSLSDDLKAILNGLSITQEGIAVVPIERINSIVVFTSTPSLLRTVESWIKRLDEEVSGGQNIFVYPIQNVEAESIIDVLKMLYETDSGSKPKTRTSPAITKTASTTQKPAIMPKSSITGASSDGSRVEIVLFEPTNSLVILAPPGIYRDMKNTIKKLDVYPQEVLIEAVIAEVTLTDSDDFGIQWSVLHDIHIEGDDFSAMTSNRSSDAPLFPSNLGTDDALRSIVAGGFSYLMFKPDKLVALVHALSSKGDVNILSSPRLLVRDQEEASIEVGSDIPTATSTTSTTTTDTLTQNIEYRTVGIKLNIKPTINEEKTVILDLEQEVSSKGADQQVGQTGNLFPAFNTTKTKTSIVVPDKQGIVIGGIMEETKDKSYQGVPVLSAIPILGNLFRYTKDSTTKKELVIIITPHVISNKTEGEKLTIEFMNKLRNVKGFLQNQEKLIGEPPMQESKNIKEVNEQ